MAMADIDQQQPATRLEYENDFDQRTLPLVASCDVMQCPAGDHDIEAAGIERQVARIGCTDLDALTDAFQPHVAQRRLRAVTRLILPAPDINANHAPRQQTLRGHREHQAMPAADIEYTLIAPPWTRLQSLVTQPKAPTSGA